MAHSPAAYPDRLIEHLFATMMVVWGLWLLIPLWETFGNPAYGAFGQVMTEQQWGIVGLAVGAVRFGALAINGRWCRTPLFRFFGSVVGVTWWLGLLWLFYCVPQVHPPAALAWYPVWAVFEGISCWRTMADAYRSNAFKPVRTPRLLSTEG